MARRRVHQVRQATEMEIDGYILQRSNWSRSTNTTLHTWIWKKGKGREEYVPHMLDATGSRSQGRTNCQDGDGKSRQKGKQNKKDLLGRGPESTEAGGEKSDEKEIVKTRAKTA